MGRRAGASGAAQAPAERRWGVPRMPGPDNLICPSRGRCCGVDVRYEALTHPLQLFSGSPSRTFRAEEKQMSGGSGEAPFIPFSAALRPPVVPPARTGVGHKVKEETIAQDTPQIKESGRYPSCGRPHFLASEDEE